MNLDHKYKQLKEEANALVEREKVLNGRINEIKKLKAANLDRQGRVAALEAELEKLMADL